MKKRLLIFVVIIMSIIVFALLIIFTSLNNNIYEFEYNNKNYSIEIPNYSYSFSNKDFNIVFKSFSNFEKINNFKNDYLNNLSMLKCNNDGINYYYDSKQDITIYNYTIDKKFVSSEISFNYYIGNYCNDKEAEDIDDMLKELNFDIQIESGLECKNITKIYSTDLYSIYSYCLDNINVIIDEQKYTLNTALNDGLINIEDIVRKFDIESKFAEATKTNYNNDILYTNYNYRLIVCNSDKYIIGSKSMAYNSNFCN